MYKSNYILPLRMVERLEVLLREYNSSLDSFLGKDTPLVSAIEYIIHKGADSGDYRLVDFSEARKVLDLDDGTVGFKYSHDYILTNALTPAWDYTRSVDELTPADFAVLLRCLRISEYGNMVLLHYNDIGMWNVPKPDDGSYVFDIYGGILHECRSVVINLKSMIIESLPFYKFFNMGERDDYSADVIYSLAVNSRYMEFTDKLDGSFIQMTRTGNTKDSGNIQVLMTSSNTITPKGNAHLEYVHKCVHEDKNGEGFFPLCCAYPELTFMFEMIYPPIDPHLVNYPREKWGLYLIGARNKNTGEILRHNELAKMADAFNLKLTVMFDDMNIDGAKEICHTASASEREGFVVNIDGFLVKIKLDEFCATSRLVNSTSFNGVIRATVDGSFDDMISKIPDAFKDKIEKNYRALLDYDEKMKEVIPDLVSKVPTDCSVKDSIMWINDNVPAAWRGFVVSGFKKGLDSLPKSYLGKNVGGKNESLFNESKFNEAVNILNDYFGS